MKNFLKMMTLTGIVIGVSFLSATFSRAAEVVEKILVIVNDEIVTDQDLDMVCAPVVAQLRTLYTGAELTAKVQAARHDFLNKLIEEKLILSEAKRKQVIVADAEVNEMITEVRNKFSTREQYLKALEDQGLTEKKLSSRFRDQTLSQKYINYEVRSKVSVSPGEISEYYKMHPEEFTQGDRVKLLQILVRVGARSEEEARAFANNLKGQIRSGKSFEELAVAYSEGTEAKEGGAMGWVERGQLLGEIDEKIFSTPVGEVTPPIQSALGYHLFKILERDQASVRALADVRSEIQDTLFKQKVKKKLDTWIENLKKSAYISIRS